MADEEKRLAHNAYMREYRRANRARTTEIERESKARKAEHYRSADHARYLIEREDRLRRAAERYVPHPVVRTRRPRAERLEQNRAHHHANREKRLAQKRAWAAANPHKSAAYATTRRAAKLKATPAWAEPFFIEGAYEIAQLRSQMTGVAWEVDHIVPLISDLVCGLHVEHNLRVIPMVMNRSKGNIHWPDMP